MGVLFPRQTSIGLKDGKHSSSSKKDAVDGQNSG